MMNSWDLRVQLQREARDKGVILPPYLQHPRVYDLQREFFKWMSYHPELTQLNNGNTGNNNGVSSSPTSTMNICKALEVRDGPYPYVIRPRRALEEADLSSSIFKSLIIRSQPKENFPDVLSLPMDLKADVRAFLQEKSKVLHMSNLPHDITQSELESWFTQYGGRPIAFWTYRTPDNSNADTGYAVFSTHEEAAESLAMNGRALNERAIEVCPSGNAVLERARNILTTFPASKNRPRPGDWTCPSCGFSNFQRRIACFRCSFPVNGSASGATHHHHIPSNQSSQSQHSPSSQPQFSHHQPHGAHTHHHALQNQNQGHKKPNNLGGGNNGSGSGSGVPFRAGDWKCANEGCNYHNFAKNMFCLRCGAARAPAAIADPHGAQKRYANASLIYGKAPGQGTSFPPMAQPLHQLYQKDQVYQMGM